MSGLRYEFLATNRVNMRSCSLVVRSISLCYLTIFYTLYVHIKGDWSHHVMFATKCNRKAMNRNWSNQKSNPALKNKAGNK